MDLEQRRLELHEKLCSILGSRNCYFQPDENIKLKYPCIVYKRDAGSTIHADDNKYRYVPEYTTTVIDRDPTSSIPERIFEEFRMSRFERSFVSDNLNHTVINIFY